jgi:hypothetical protein
MGPQHSKRYSQAGALASLRTLSGIAGKQCFATTVVGLDRKFLTLRCEAPIGSGTPVRVDVEGGLLLGEVAWSSTAESDITVIEIDQIIPSVPDVLQLVRAIMGEVDRKDTERSCDAVAAGSAGF